MTGSSESKSKNTNPVWLRPADRQRLEHLCHLETRSMVDQMTIVIAEAFERRGLDLNACTEEPKS